MIQLFVLPASELTIYRKILKFVLFLNVQMDQFLQVPNADVFKVLSKTNSKPVLLAFQAVTSATMLKLATSAPTDIHYLEQLAPYAQNLRQINIVFNVQTRNA